MQKRRVQSAENTKRIFSLKVNGHLQVQKFAIRPNMITEGETVSAQNAQSIAKGLQKEKNNLFNNSNHHINMNDISTSFEESRRAAYNVANYYAGPRKRIQSQDTSIDIMRNSNCNKSSTNHINNQNSPQSTGQIKRKIIMKRKISAFPQDFFSSTQGDVNKSTGTADLSQQLRVINKDGKLVERYDKPNNPSNNIINNHNNQQKLKSNSISRNNTERLNNSLGNTNAIIRKSDLIDVNMKDIFLRGSQKNLVSGSNNFGNTSILGVTGKTFSSQTNVVNRSSLGGGQSGGAKKLNSSIAVNGNTGKIIDNQNQMLQTKEVKEVQSNFKILTPKFNIFEGISQKANTISCTSQINNNNSNKVQSLNLNDLIKYQNPAVNNSSEVQINPNDLSIQNECIAPIDTNRSINSESVTNIAKTHQSLLNVNKLKPPKPGVQLQKQSSNKQKQSSLQKENRCYSAQIDEIQKTACFSDLMDQNSLECFSKEMLFHEGSQEQFSDINFTQPTNQARNSLQHYTFTEKEEDSNKQSQDKSKLKQKNSLQKFISQEDKIPAVFRQMLIPKKARPNSHNNQQIQPHSQEKINVMKQLKEQLDNNNSITLRELDQMFDDSIRQDENNSSYIQSHKEIVLAAPLPNRDNQMRNMNMKRLENTLYQINQNPLYNKIYNQGSNTNINPMNQTKGIVKRRSYSLQRQESTSTQEQINSTVSHINRDHLSQNTKSQEYLHTSSKKDQNKKDVFEFSFSKMFNRNNEKQQEKELSQFGVQQKDQGKAESGVFEKNCVMNSTFNPNYFKQQQNWNDNNIHNNSIKQNQIGQTKMTSFQNNKENIYSESEPQNPLNSSINYQKKQYLLGSKRLIFDAKSVNQSFNSQLQKVSLHPHYNNNNNNNSNLLNTQSFKIVNK